MSFDANLQGLRRGLFAGLAAIGLALGAQSAQAVPVDLELSLAVDISGSIDDSEYDLQMAGYRDAFNSAGVQAAIDAVGGIAVNMVFFASDATEVIGWTLLGTGADAGDFADDIDFLRAVGLGSGRGVFGIGSSTNIADGVSLATSGIAGNAFEGERSVIDVSGDGAHNTGPLSELTSAVTAALLVADSINGLAIDATGSTTIFDYYAANVSTSGFTVAASFETFGTAVEDKIEREVTGVPEPATLFLLGGALIGLAGVRRRAA